MTVTLSPSGFDPAIGRAGNALIAALIDLAGGEGELLAHGERTWASATYQGARHKLLLEFNGSAAVARGEAMCDALPTHEFKIPGWLVVDAQVRAVDRAYGAEPRLRVEAELLLLEER